MRQSLYWIKTKRCIKKYLPGFARNEQFKCYKKNNYIIVILQTINITNNVYILNN